MRSIIPAMAVVFGLVGLAGCADPYDGANTYSARPVAATTTTTTVVRDANGAPLSTAETVRDANGNPVNLNPPGAYQGGPGYYQYVPGYAPQPYAHN